MRPTHFISVPLYTGAVFRRFCELKEQLLASKLAGIDEQLVQDERRIHLTLGVCTLRNAEEVAKACALLGDCIRFTAGLRTPFNVKVKSLKAMNGNPMKARVLYGVVEAPELQAFANSCMTPFKAAGLIPAGNRSASQQPVKLHMTVLNNSYRRTLPKKARPRCFDAREVISKFGNFDFGETECAEILLCDMSHAQIIDGRYKIAGTLKLPAVAH